MPDWKIIRIVEDVQARDADRWLIVYAVAPEYAPDGVFSFSVPKGILNTCAAVYEYDLDNPDEVDDLFDHVMSTPMLSLVPTASGPPRRSVAPGGADRHGAFGGHPGDLRAAIKARVADFKAGAGRLTAAEVVELDIPGMPSAADPGENPKYILKRDMLSRLDKDRVRRDMQVHRRERELVMEEIARKGEKNAASR